MGARKQQEPVLLVDRAAVPRKMPQKLRERQVGKTKELFSASARRSFGDRRNACLHSLILGNRRNLWWPNVVS